VAEQADTPKELGISGPVVFCFSYVTSGKALNILVPYFLISKMKIITLISLGYEDGYTKDCGN